MLRHLIPLFTALFAAVWPLCGAAADSEALGIEAFSPDAAMNQAAPKAAAEPEPGVQAPVAAEALSKIDLGEALFNDRTLSEPPVQACVDCHSPVAGFANPGGQVLTPGANGRFGPRNAPSVAYAAFIPKLHFIEYSKRWAGGQFWDGRAQSLAEQALGPLFSGHEMNLTAAKLQQRLAAAPYKDTLTAHYGEDIWKDPDAAATAVGDALTEFQLRGIPGRFTSKFDAWRVGRLDLDELEARGAFVFQDRGKCMNCHTVYNGMGDPVYISDFSYHNLGLPRNLQSPFLHIEPLGNPDGVGFVDIGLAASPYLPEAARAGARGKFRTPSLRNVALTAPYMHNGVFKTLREVVEFYNTRDTDPRWGPPEVSETMDTENMGNLQLSERDIDALVAFMQTMTDGYSEEPPTAPSPE